MGTKYQAEKRVEHVAIASAPDMICPTPKDPPLPFITYAEFDTAANVADQAAGNQYPLFTSKSMRPARRISSPTKAATDASLVTSRANISNEAFPATPPRLLVP